ncbi:MULTISPECIES: Cof-type HAD-IIB family hydrolase [unclassified Bacillus (in: firmicutes)]|uniref:Cof-type HAD-IIB family hydrolase n=1 Tax=unclassified Bacillus (in: firmicutes) TaxID=185979 RepID=UPI00232FBFC5|nr:Cof-type HAD-IIB family hydrolase [Bacillus sp. BP-3]MDC2864346.1 Cof-type HAD-IIB family hydrolase [Bacillus sp. BP-3]
MKLIAIDLDGTLLTSKKVISEENAEAIKECQKKGHVVAICTGRSMIDVHKLLQETNLQCPIIAENGAILYLDNEMIQRYPIVNEHAEEIVDYLEEKNISYQLYTDQGVYIPKYGEEIIQLEMDFIINSDIHVDEKELKHIAALYLQHTETKTIESCKPLFSEPIHIHKILPFSYQREKLKLLKEQFIDNEELSITASYWHNLEINHLHAQKGNGLYTLANHLGILKEHTVAIGDGLNDISMMEKANISIAMGNAVEEIQALCHYKTLSNDDHGVAHALRRYIIG